MHNWEESITHKAERTSHSELRMVAKEKLHQSVCAVHIMLEVRSICKRNICLKYEGKGDWVVSNFIYSLDMKIGSYGKPDITIGKRLSASMRKQSKINAN